MDAITGKTAKKQYALAVQAQQDQAARVAEEKARVDAVDASQEAQRRVRVGGRGMTAFVDTPAIANGEGLYSTFGRVA